MDDGRTRTEVSRVVCTPADRSIVRADDGGEEAPRKCNFANKRRRRHIVALILSHLPSLALPLLINPYHVSPNRSHRQGRTAYTPPSQCSVLTLMKQKPRFLRRFSKASIIKIENEGIGSHQTLNELHNLKNPRSQAISELLSLGQEKFIRVLMDLWMHGRRRRAKNKGPNPETEVSPCASDCP